MTSARDRGGKRPEPRRAPFHPRRSSSRDARRIAAAGAFALIALPVTLTAASPAIEVRTSTVVYGEDGRREWFAHGAAPLRALSASSGLALVDRRRLRISTEVVESLAPSWGEAANLCRGEPFADQPALAACTATWVESDLALTAGHCLDSLPCDSLVAVLGFYYRSAGRIAPLASSNLFECAEILAKEVRPPADDTQVDYAWIRLRSATNRQPARKTGDVIRAGRHLIDKGTPLATFGFGGGVPMKLEDGGRVALARDDVADYFVSTLDLFHGASGSSVLDDRLELVGIVGRGAVDFIETAEGCRVTRHRPDDDVAAREHATYAQRAVDALCATVDGHRYEICRGLTETPREDQAARSEAKVAGCSVAARSSGAASGRGVCWLLFIVVAAGTAGNASASSSTRGRRSSSNGRKARWSPAERGAGAGDDGG